LVFGLTGQLQASRLARCAGISYCKQMPVGSILTADDAGTILKSFLYDWFERIRADNGPRWNPVKTVLWNRIAAGWKNQIVNNDIEVTSIGSAVGGAYYNFREQTDTGDPWFTMNALRPVIPGRRGCVSEPSSTSQLGYCSHVFSYNIQSLLPNVSPRTIYLQQGSSVFYAWLFAVLGSPIGAPLVNAGSGAASATAGSMSRGAGEFFNPFANTVFDDPNFRNQVRTAVANDGSKAAAKAKLKLKYRAGDLNVRAIYNQLNRSWQAGTFAAALADERPQAKQALDACRQKITTGIARLTIRVQGWEDFDVTDYPMPLPPFHCGVEIWDGMLRDWDYNTARSFVEGLVEPKGQSDEPDWEKIDGLLSQSLGHSAVMRAMTKSGTCLRWMADPDSWNDRTEFDGISMHYNPMLAPSAGIQA
jgi:hypothetical protein